MLLRKWYGLSREGPTFSSPGGILKSQNGLSILHNPKENEWLHAKNHPEKTAVTWVLKFEAGPSQQLPWFSLSGLFMI